MLYFAGKPVARRVEVAALAGLAVGVAVGVDRRARALVVQLGGVAEQRVLDRVDLAAVDGLLRAERTPARAPARAAPVLTWTRCTVPVASSSEMWSARNVHQYVK